jgi:hypothetical protein
MTFSFVKRRTRARPRSVKPCRGVSIPPANRLPALPTQLGCPRLIAQPISFAPSEPVAAVKTTLHGCRRFIPEGPHRQEPVEGALFRERLVRALVKVSGV